MYKYEVLGMDDKEETTGLFSVHNITTNAEMQHATHYQFLIKLRITDFEIRNY